MESAYRRGFCHGYARALRDIQRELDDNGSINSLDDYLEFLDELMDWRIDESRNSPPEKI